MQFSRKNHYVPEWYQRGFLPGSKSKLNYLDLDPQKKELPNGRIVARKALDTRSPKRCFRKMDLYTTRFGRTLNDEIEKFLFGRIDTIGARAVRAFIGGDPRAMHEHFQVFFEYLNAQKMRTPKGLDWIKNSYPSLSQEGLMLEMQHLRRMHCTMWVESVREFVSAEKSNVKFIVTDHPVTVYNPACPPASSYCQYPEDPSIGMVGTQTVFALDSDHCLILTNLEYARNPAGVDLLAPRQNARFSGRTLARTDKLIRTRFLTPDEVVSMNSLLKTRSRQYLAAYDKTWLFPEAHGTIPWEEIGRILLPPDNMLWEFGGETFVGYKDGSIEYQDAFGRTDTSYRFLKKESPPAAPAQDDPCGCGSGRRFKECCSSVAIEERPPWDVYSIRDRNKILCNAVGDILGLDKGKSWEDVRRELSNDQVTEVHKIFQLLWPKDTNLADLLPRPDGRVFRTVYMGYVDPRTICISVISSLAYFDEVVVLNPFPNPVYIAPEYSPIYSPEQHKSQMLKNVFVLLTLEPFIDAGMVHLVPDPMEFNADFRHEVMAMAKERQWNSNPTDEEMKVGMALAKDEFKRITFRLPEDDLRQWLRQSQPDVDPELLEGTIEYAKEEVAQDPFALLQPVPIKKDGGEFQVFRGFNLELALFVAHLTGSAIYTDEPFHWKQLHEHASAEKDRGQHSEWAPLAEMFCSLTLTVEANPEINLEIRRSGNLGDIRSAFRCICNSVLTCGEDTDVNEAAIRLATDLENAGVQAGIEWETFNTTTAPFKRFPRRMEISIPNEGFYLNSVHRMLVTSGRAKYLESVPLALFLSFPRFRNNASVD